RHFDAGHHDTLRQALDTPEDGDDVVTLADRWLSTLQEHEERAAAIIAQITVLSRLWNPEA
ncbi:MAG: hypothetical protein KC615_23805, partial [Anaerolineae bacterium]|nr:hypothetical protein [Anaerolineae bacterium]